MNDTIKTILIIVIILSLIIFPTWFLNHNRVVYEEEFVLLKVERASTNPLYCYAYIINDEGYEAKLFLPMNQMGDINIKTECPYPVIYKIKQSRLGGFSVAYLDLKP